MTKKIKKCRNNAIRESGSTANGTVKTKSLPCSLGMAISCKGQLLAPHEAVVYVQRDKKRKCKVAKRSP